MFVGKIFILSLRLLQLSLGLYLFGSDAGEIFLNPSKLRFKFLYPFLKDFLFRLEELCLLLLIPDVPLYLILKLLLHLLEPIFILGFHFGDDSLVHFDHLVERVGDAVTFLLEVVDLVLQGVVGGLILPALAALLLDAFEVGSLPEDDVVRQFARGER